MPAPPAAALLSDDAKGALADPEALIAHLLVTRGERGMVLYGPGGPPLVVEGERREVYDVSGAGDTVLAALASALAAGAAQRDAVGHANRAAGVVAGTFGSATVTRHEIATALCMAEEAR